MYVLRKYTKILPTRQVKRIGAVFFASLLMIYTNCCAMENNGRGVKAVGMANAFVAISDDPWAINYNPAGLTQIYTMQCSAFMVPEQYGLEELRTTAIAASVPLSFSTLGFKVEYFGFDLYNETEFGIAIAGKIDRNVSTGISLNYQRLDIKGYGTEGNFMLDAGILAQVTERVRAGFSIQNVTGTTIGKIGDKIPQVCAFGISWFPLYDLLLTIEMEKDVRFPASIKFGIEQIVLHVFALRAGVANNPDKYSAGIALKYSSFEFGYAAYSHPDLGWTHQIELSFQLAH